MREGTRNFMVGMASIGSLIGLSALMMSFGEFDPWFNPRYSLTIKADNAAGLKPGGAIEFNGVPVGVVSNVTIEDDPQHPVHVHLLINQDVRLPTDVQPFAAAPLIGGSRARRLVQPSRGRDSRDRRAARCRAQRGGADARRRRPAGPRPHPD